MTSPNDVQIIFNLNIYCSIASDFAGKFREKIGESFRERNHIMKRSFSELLGEYTSQILLVAVPLRHKVII